MQSTDLNKTEGLVLWFDDLGTGNEEFRFLSNFYKGEPLNQPMVAADHYLHLTAQQVQDAFRKYLKPKHLVQVVQGPAPAKH